MERDELELGRTDLPAVADPEEDDIRIPSREEHRRFVRRLWILCIGVASVLFLGTGAVVLALFLGGHDSRRVVEVSTSIFQIVVLTYGMGFFVPAFLTSLIKMAMGVEMSRKGLHVGKQTAEALRQFRREIKPILEDVSKVVGAARDLVNDLSRHDVGQIVQFVERIRSDGTVDRLVKSLEDIAKEVNGAISRAKADAVSKEIDQL